MANGLALVIKIFYFVVAIFSVTLVFLFSTEPYLADAFKQDTSIASMQANVVTDYEINATKIAAVYEASQVNRYASQDVASDFRAVVLRDNSTHFMRSNEAVIKGDEIKFTGDAKYENNESVEFFSQEIIFDQKRDLLRSDVPFELMQNSDKVTGMQVEYNIKDKQTRAKGVKAWVEQERK